MSEESVALYIGRQPILDREQCLVGYELLYRDQGAANSATFVDGTQATTTVLTNALLEMGLNRVVGDRWAFINLTRDFITGEKPVPLESDRVVVEVLEDVEVNDQVVEGLGRLAEGGYRIALDDFVYSPPWEPCLALSDIVKVDVLGKSDIELFEIAELLKGYGVALLAEKVEDHETHRKCLDLGFDLFQGYFFAKPEVLQQRRIDASRALLLATLAVVNDDEADDKTIADSVSQDARLTHKLLRYVNSSAIGLRRSVDSIQHAITYLGRTTVRSLTTLLLLSSIEGKPAVLLRTALVRAEACRNIGRLQGSGKDELYFTAGLLSLLDALLDEPLTNIIEELPLSADLREALLNHRGPVGECLMAVIAMEQLRASEEVSKLGDSLCLGAYADAVAAVESGKGFAAVAPVEEAGSFIEDLPPRGSQGEV